ncbi:phosphatidate cytidylyltransferase [Heliophilum fasciatum]|uniref:Phosphatidate cytidylyltransferase n=1 Tax=Heliophilum fasciatum TaxID=35700 RepID=A0A4R2RMY0_9FIRM|nr:phosphatidate cytidylyltransferase [Heliophilum fasciatum]MCW2277907.1 phosphatidate cytidylyltransferase [Heliophilum fasciatum]TCP64523.1 phosphatidate cytidylyltransferase [Heliophilum fasciatum]
MLWMRTVSAAVGIPLLLYLVYLGGWFFTITVGVLALIGFYEYDKMMKNLDVEGPTWLGYLIAGLLPLTAHFQSGLVLGLTVSFWAGLALWVIAYPRISPVAVGTTIFGALMVGGLLSYLLLLRQFPQGEWTVLLTFLLTWATDTGAYFAGRFLGRHRLAPRVSPKKTWEGSIGGALLASLVAMVCGPLWFPQIDVLSWAIAALIISALGQFGDLVESALKRMAGIKDSGTILPGHGGVLDRFDSTLWTAPAMYYFLTWVARF